MNKSTSAPLRKADEVKNDKNGESIENSKNSENAVNSALQYKAEPDECEALKLKNQLCFPIYAALREIQKKYTPFLEELNLTYTQYLIMLVLWERGSIGFKELGKLLFLDSGTLTPVSRSLEKKGLIERFREKSDERRAGLLLKPKGAELKERAKKVPSKMLACMNMSLEEAQTLKELIYKLFLSENQPDCE